MLFMDPLILSGIAAAAGNFLSSLFHKNKPKPQSNNSGNLLASAGINLGSSLLSNLLGSAFSRSNSRFLMSYQQMLQKQQQSWLWQNQYGQSVAGMRMAGLNPTMLAGQQSPISASMPSAINNSYSPIDASAIAQLAQLSLLPSQQKINEATAANIDADTANKNADTSNKGLQGELMSNELFTWFESWQNQQYLLGSQANSNIQSAALAAKTVEQRDEEIKSIMEQVKNLIEIRNQIKTQTGLIASQKVGQDKANARYDEYMDKTIDKIVAEANFTNHDDARQAATVVKALVRMQLDNENAVWQQELLQNLDKAQDLEYSLNSKYGDVERFLGVINQAFQAAQSGASMYYGLGSRVTTNFNADGKVIGSSNTRPFWQWPTH